MGEMARSRTARGLGRAGAMPSAGERARPAGAWWGIALVLGADLCWGLISVLVKLLFNRGAVTPAVLIAVRVSLSFFLLLLVLAPRRGRRLAARGSDLGLLVTMGLVGFAANGYFYYKTISLTNVATAILLAYLAPIFLTLHAGLVLGRWPPRGMLAAIGLAIGGCFILVKGYDMAILRLNLPGLLFGLATAAAFAAFTVTSQRAMRRYDTWTVLLYGYGIATLVWWVAFPPWRLLAAGYPLRLWGAFLLLALVGTLIPFGLFVRGLAYLSATQATIVSTLEPVVAGIAAYLVLGEAMAPVQYAGALLVLVAVVLVQLRPEPPQGRD